MILSILKKIFINDKIVPYSINFSTNFDIFIVLNQCQRHAWISKTVNKGLDKN